MSKSKYIDISSIVQIIGGIYSNPKILEANDKYFFDEDDFVDDFHKIVFGSIYNLYQHGVKEITLSAIEDYLVQRPKKFAEYKANKGSEYILKCAEICKPAAFDYYYNRMKKMTLFRTYEKVGMDMSAWYNPDTLNSKEKQKQEDWLDNTPLEEIANIIDNKILEVRMKCVDNASDGGSLIGEGLDELLESLKENPEFGYPLPGKYINTMTRGARFGKFYLRSAATGVGKSRAMVADIGYIGCSQIYDINEDKWVSTGAPQSALYISTELSKDECQTMFVAYISGVNEEHILNGEYYTGEWERVKKAAMLLRQSKIIIEVLPDFSLIDVENIIKRNIRENECRYIGFDYIHTSMGILAEITKSSGGVRLREDNILFLMSAKLKDIANQYNVWIVSSTQLNADYRENETPDQNLLRGSKAIADRIDLGMILLEVTQKDKESITPICKQLGIPVDSINVKMSIYKNRRGRYKSEYLWMIADRGICRFEPQFATTWNYSLEDITDIKLRIQDESAF